MVETRSQTGNITVKKEEDSKPSLDLESVRNTRASARIAKRKSPIINNRPVPAQQVKLEEDTDTKSLLQSSTKFSKSGKRRYLSQEQINQLIDYIVKENMSIAEASRKVNISKRSAYSYYTIYKSDPEKKIPLPRNLCIHPRTYCAQEKIGNLIKYVDDDKMTVKEASAKTNMTYCSALYYYNKYLKDPNHNIPMLKAHQRYTQDQKNEFIDCIVRDKMSVLAASKKAKIGITTAYDYYHRYFNVQNPDIARPSHSVIPKCYTQEQIKEVISYIVDDEMSIRAALKKANISPNIHRRRFHRYPNDQKRVRSTRVVPAPQE